jgi:hypothetical protein
MRHVELVEELVELDWELDEVGARSGAQGKG